MGLGSVAGASRGWLGGGITAVASSELTEKNSLATCAYARHVRGEGRRTGTMMSRQTCEGGQHQWTRGQEQTSKSSSNAH